MRFDHIKIHEMGCFRDVSIDISAVQGTLIAVCGANGAGKSTLLGMLAAGLYRECPTRGTLGDLAHARDSFIEVGVVNGARHTIRHQVDAASGKGECLVTDASGKAELPSTGIRPFEAWAKQHLPPQELLFCSTFAPQGSKGMLALTAGERKAVILRAMGLERFERFAAEARKKAAEARVAFTLAQTRLNDARSRAVPVASAQSDLDNATKACAAAGEAHKAARNAYDDAKLAAADKAVFAKEVRQANERREAALKRLGEVEAQSANVMTRIMNNEKVIARKDEIESAVREFEAAKVALSEAEESARKHEAEESRLVAEMRRIAAELDNRIKFGLANEKRKLDAAEAALADLPMVEAAEASLVGQREAVATAERGEAEAFAAVEAARGIQLVSASARVTALRSGLEYVHKSIDHGQAVLAAKVAIDEDDAAVDRTTTAPKVLADAIATHDAAKTTVNKARAELRAAEQAAAKRSAVDFAQTAKTDAAKAIDALTAERIALQSAGDALVGPADAAKMGRVEAMARAEMIRSNLLALSSVAGLATPLATAQERLVDLQESLAGLQRDHVAITEELEGITQYPSEPEDFDLGAFEFRLGAADRAHDEAKASVARATANLETAKKQAAELVALLAAHDAAGEDHEQWAQLGDDLGRDGIQALEIDAVGPELTELTNDLLRTCVGPRWSVTIEAKRSDSEGKRELDGCEILVLDTESGRQGPVETLSGGEGVIVGEAVSLALMMLSCKRAGGEAPTLVRDESGAALDQQNAPAYIAMLRRAAELVGASKVLFVSHSPAIVALADARIEVANGTATVWESAQ